MSTSHLPQNKKDRSVRPRKHDQYKAKGKLQEPSVCRECKAVYHKGRWTWDPVPPNSQDIVCPACHRMQDGAPSGVLLLTGEFVASHREEVLGLARNEEARVKAEHPLARIIKIEDQAKSPEGVIITTTDPHLARRIGEALHHAHHGTFTCRYEENEDLLRANWES
ncbi:MAG TPA: BCAM0308 family protein [Nitrospira sp.]|nr:BCAM0308 family protein [Nitrospira sp.]